MVSVDPQNNPQLVRGVFSARSYGRDSRDVVVACQRLYCYGKKKGGSDTRMFFFNVSSCLIQDGQKPQRNLPTGESRYMQRAGTRFEPMTAALARAHT